MEALKCPVCEGRQAVSPGFYGVGTETKCRSCDGKGYVLAPEQQPTRYEPVPYYPWPVYPSSPYPTLPGVQWWSVWTDAPNTTGTMTVTTTPWEPTSRVDFNNDGTVLVPQFSIVQ